MRHSAIRISDVVFAKVNRTQSFASDAASNGVALTREGRKAFYRAYELLVDTLVAHPIFAHLVSYARNLWWAFDFRDRLIGTQNRTKWNPRYYSVIKGCKWARMDETEIGPK